MFQMTLNRMMHPRNPYKDKPPDFGALADKYADFRSHCYVGANGKMLLNFRDSDAVRSLARTLLHNDFGLDVELPAECLVPRVPQRLNYILWIDDLLTINHITENITGIDIGTGASCIYALLGAKVFGWHFTATDTDSMAVEVASKNVQTNDLGDHIEIVQVEEDRMIKDVVRSRSDKHFTFCMCNPPFFEQEESEQKFIHLAGKAMTNFCSGDPQRPAPHSATVARSNELSVCGGEVAFVGRLIDDSIVLQKAVALYTSMVGKKSSLPELKKKLKRCPNVRYAVGTLNQGKTLRWVLAWTFHPELKLSLESKDCAPLEIPLPRLLSSTENITVWVKKTLTSLDISFELLENGEVQCEATKNTWSQQRQRRRASRSASCCRSYISNIGRGMNSSPEEKRMRYSHCDATTSADLGVGDGKDSLANSGNFSECLRTACVTDEQRFHVSVQAYIPSTVDMQSLVRFRIIIPSEGQVVQLKWIDGSRHALHQISQYFRNQLTKFSSAGDSFV